ncbi:MAG: hypothetical protein FJY56_09970 [Betaproteobacteria bacterium]|nr:hypothetical protein [Betaproteobacteria bacterium]
MASNGTKYIYAGGDADERKGDPHNYGGLFRCTPGEGEWQSMTQGLPPNVSARAFAVNPNDPRVIYVGTQDGVYRSLDAGEHWQRPNFPDRNVDIYAITYHPTRPNVLYAGAAPVALYRSEDGGENWKKMPAARAPKNCDMDFPVRIIRMAIDPSRPNDIYLALEVDGVIRSSDGGETFTDVSKPLIELAELPHLKSRIGSTMESEGMLDSHAITVSAAAPGQPILAVRMGLFRGTDGGAAWRDMQVGRFSPITYARDVCVSPHNPRTLYACLSTAARSDDGRLYRSDDLGESWRRVDHTIQAKGTMMAVTVSHADPKRVYCVSRCGQVFGTEDEGASWREYPLPAGVLQRARAVACA